MEKFYYLLEIAYTQSNYEKIYYALYLSGINKILEENGIIKVYFRSFEHARAKSLARNLLSLPALSREDIVITKVKTLDWNESWMKSIEPVYIKNHIIITPSWKKNTVSSLKDLIVIEIDPKMSFGTGHNETTQLMLEMMIDHIDNNDHSMLDYGCGTGILAIAGIKLGLRSAIAIDIDNDAIGNAVENFSKNHVNKKIKLYKSNIKDVDAKNFDIVCANINYTVISKSLRAIRSRLKSNGKLFITGMLTEEKQPMIDVLKKNKFEIVSIYEEAEWAALYCKKQ